ncbi:uncharacterized protein BP5553_05562 [Venustampulla echinocandica]|uniref:Uncharacterized protein n=1 Tax=Venustampulla echinocandica TaxID=2656787 RepID=A0A370TRH6_9HELO|nr:uncharacterized protein BP5553_05562 [Venustampulla echinocandica]RDL38129.1 hypothetical protein BP5553_05562 [Venustampulla echinocandica]
MGLVDYSDSETSDVEETKPVKTSSHSSKPAFQKVVDRANPGKIRVTLPQAAVKDDTKNDEPPTKRAKTGGGAFSGFNSFLPPPKRAGQVTNATLGGGNAARKGGLGAGVSLKTGAAPGFSREPGPERDNENYGVSPDDSTTGGNSLNLPPPIPPQNGEQKPAEEVKLVGKPLMFRPLSVARKPAKKKTSIMQSPASSAPPTAPTPPTNPSTPQPGAAKARARPKVSLFSISSETSNSISTPSNGEYQPMILNESTQTEDQNLSAIEPTYEEYTPTTSHIAPPAVPTPPVSQSLDDIAGDLNLSAAERRQLFGRQKGGRGVQAATKVINFNTDEEYLRNEELRASGEQVVHNPVRAIAPGKHSLKQLVNAAQSQKDALEESFAKGKSNRAEASSRYGWKDEDPQEYLDEISVYIRRNADEQDTKEDQITFVKAIFKATLQGKAKNWYIDEVTRTTRADWNQLQKEFKESFELEEEGNRELEVQQKFVGGLTNSELQHRVQGSLMVSGKLDAVGQLKKDITFHDVKNSLIASTRVLGKSHPFADDHDDGEDTDQTEIDKILKLFNGTGEIGTQ